ncbi:hypothetical protein Aduo_003573 [Ancylostoma duodenale]
MNEFPHLRIVDSEEEKQSIDDASFVTARESFTMDRAFNQAMRPRKRKLVTPRKYFLNLMARILFLS